MRQISKANLYVISNDDAPLSAESMLVASPRKSKAELRSRYFDLRQLVHFHRRKHLEAAGAYLMAMLDYKYSAKLEPDSDAPDLLLKAHHLWENSLEATEDYRAALLVFKNAADDYRERGGKV